MQCFEDSPVPDQLDREAFKFKHKLMGHPALSLENLQRVIPSLPKERVMYSKALLQKGDDFEATLKQRPADRTIEETIESIRVSDGYVMVQSPEIDPSFAPLHRELLADVQTLMRRRGVGTEAIDPQLYLFIASPNAVTPFHIDRYSTFLMQFRGSKEVTVFPQWDERVVPSVSREAYVAYANSRLAWSPQADALGTKYQFAPGEAIHIPFVAGHHVRNGGDDVSISMSIIFNTAQSMAWRRALSFNHASRRVLGRFRISPAPVGRSPWRDSAKARIWSAVAKVKSARR